MPSFDLQPKYDGASPTKFEPKYEPNLSMENSNSNSQQLVGGETRIGMVGGVAEAPPRNILLAPENNSISMTLMQWESTTPPDANYHQCEPPLETSETL